MNIEQPTKTAIADYTTDDATLEKSASQDDLAKADLESDSALPAEGEPPAVSFVNSMAEAESDDHPVEEAVAVIDAAFESWKLVIARSDAACHQLLGEIFVRSKTFDDDANLKLRLIPKVKRHPDFPAPRQFDGMKKSGAELLLTMLFGLKENRSTKSNWLRAVTIANSLAEMGKLDRTVEAFVTWFAPLGFEGAFKLGREPKGTATLEPFLDLRGEDVDLPAPLPADFDLPEGFVIAVMRVGEAGDRADRGDLLGYVNDAKLIASVCKVLMKRQKAEDDEFVRDGIAASGDPALLIPERHRHYFDGSSHFTDEDQRDEFNRERMAEAKRIRANPGLKTQEELAKKGRGKGKLPLDRKGEVVTSLPNDDGGDFDEEQNIEPGTTPPPSLPEAQPREIPSADQPTMPEIRVDSSGSEESMDEAVEEEVE